MVKDVNVKNHVIQVLEENACEFLFILDKEKGFLTQNSDATKNWKIELYKSPYTHTNTHTHPERQLTKWEKIPVI